MKKMFSIKVPTKQHLKKYITLKYGDPIRITNNNLIGVMVFNMANKNVRSMMVKNDRDLRMKFFNDELIFKTPVTNMRTVGLGLSDDAIIQLNRFFETMFENDLYEFCKRHIDPTCRRAGYDKAITMFADQYAIDLDSDISFEALKKTEFRMRKKYLQSFGISPTAMPPRPF